MHQHLTPNNAFNKTKTIFKTTNGVLQTYKTNPRKIRKTDCPTSKTEVAFTDQSRLMYSELSNIHASHFDRQLLDAYQSYQQKNDQRSWWQKLTAPPINSNVDGYRYQNRYNMALTLDPASQTTAQKVADCVTNNPNATDCNNVLSPAFAKSRQWWYEKALVRSIGIAVIDVKAQRFCPLLALTQLLPCR